MKKLLLISILFFGTFFFTKDVFAASNVFYSVGQSSSNLLAGTSVTLTLTSGAGIFNVAQSNNIGVGDRVTYDSDNKVAFIAAKTNSDQKHWTLITATGGTPTDVTGVTVTSIKHEYTTLSAAIAGAKDANHINNTSLTAADVELNIPCYYDSGADTTAVTVSGYTTDATRYIKIYTPTSTTTEANASQRHQGKWDDGKYYTKENDSSGFNIVVYEDYVRIEGLQIKYTRNSGSGYDIYLAEINASSDIRISSNILAGTITGTATGYGTWVNDADATVKYWNNIVYGFADSGNGSIGFLCGSPNKYLYNNTIYNCSTGVYAYNTGTLKNNLVYGNTTDYYLASGAVHSNNISSDATSPDSGSTDCGTHSCRSQTVVFQDSANSDFHLASTDTGAKNAGANLSSDANLPFTTDIDGQNRPGIWDIGADETVTDIYYSVGQNTSDHKTGSPTITLSGFSATLSIGQTAPNMGVGDLITYTGGSCYITSKTSDDKMHWNCQNATGGTAPQVSGVSVTSIAHAYNSLSAAEAGAPDASHLNTSDLNTGNYVLNIPCYYDTGPDTTGVSISGWTTASNNYIKVYTPTSTSTEANSSQRHQGKWDDTKYKLTPTNVQALEINVSYIRFDGLQVRVLSPSQNNYIAIIEWVDANSSIWLNNNILDGQESTYIGGMLAYNPNSANVKMFDNIVYGCKRPFTAAINLNVTTGYVYNNTVYNNYTGIAQNAGTIVAKNNIAYGNNDNYYGTFDVSSTNNLSGPTQTDAPGSNPQNAKTVNFVDSANADFHLAESDTSARNAGADLSSDTYLPFTTDIDGQTRNVKAHIPHHLWSR